MAIIDVVKYNGSPDVFAWKYPTEELGTWTQLIVNESQEALLFKGGQALDLFTGGRHTLETANIPLLRKFVNLPFGGRSPFTAEIWYINKIHSLDVKWGTATPIQLQDPKYKVFIPLRAYGQFGIQIKDSRKFITGLVGTVPVFSKEHLANYFKGLYLTKAKDAISSYLVKKEISVLEINAYLDELSDFLQERIGPTMDEYGIRLLNFYVNDISVPEEDPAVKKLKDALSKKAEMDIVGYNYTQERSFNTLEGAAKNPGSGSAGIMGAGLGLGMGVGMGGAMGGQFGNMAQNISVKETKKCSGCGKDMDKEQRFCPSCGHDDSPAVTKPDSDTTTCSACGHKFLKTYKFCPDCGDSYVPCVYCGEDFTKGADVCGACGKKAPRPCSNCNALLSEGAKFCPECGESAVKNCDQCGAMMAEGVKFCPECGNKF